MTGYTTQTLLLTPSIMIYDAYQQVVCDIVFAFALEQEKRELAVGE